jgi:hypothetical protein
MEINYPQPTAARNSHDILQICESIGFTPKDRKAIDAARRQAEDINATTDKILADPSHCARYEHFSWLHREIDRLEQVLIDEPTYMHAEIFHAAIVRLAEAKQSQERIGAALNIAGQRISQSLAAIVQAHLDKVQSRIETEANSRRGELAATRHGLFNNSDERRALESRVAQLLADLGNVRTEAAQDPLEWLMREGLMDHEPEQADTEAA